MATIEPVIKFYEEISDAEWIMFKWEEVTTFSDVRQRFLRCRVRPLDESIRMAGGSIKDLEQYRHALYSRQEGEVIPDYETVKRDPNSPWLQEE